MINSCWVYKSLKHRASLQSTPFYVISENFSFLHYKLFEYFELFEFYSNIFYSTNNFRYWIWTIWLRQIVFDSDQNKYSFVHCHIYICTAVLYILSAKSYMLKAYYYYYYYYNQQNLKNITRSNILTPALSSR